MSKFNEIMYLKHLSQSQDQETGKGLVNANRKRGREGEREIAKGDLNRTASEYLRFFFFFFNNESQY